MTEWDWAHESAARRSDAYGAGLRDGEAAFKAGRPASSCDPADWDERYAANYRNGWEHAYHGAARDAAAGPLGGRYQITYTTGLPAIGAATLTRTVTAYSYAAARGAAEEYARKVGNESGAVLAIAGITRL